MRGSGGENCSPVTTSKVPAPKHGPLKSHLNIGEIAGAVVVSLVVVVVSVLIGAVETVGPDCAVDSTGVTIVVWTGATDDTMDGTVTGFSVVTMTIDVIG